MITYRKPYRIKKKKSIFRNRFFWLSILVLLFFGVMFYLICFAPFFQIKEIKIIGTQKVSTTDLENFIEKKITQKFLLSQSKSIFLIKSSKIKSDILKNFPQIEDENLKMKFPNILILEIKERKEIGCYCRKTTIFLPAGGGRDFPEAGSYCFFLDKNGIIFEKILQPCPLDFVIKDSKEEELNLGEKIIDEDTLLKIRGISQRVKNYNPPINKEVFGEEGQVSNFKISILEFDILEDKLVAKTSEGWEIYFNLNKDIDWQLTELELLLESKISLQERKNLEYIDLRFSKIFWKFR